VSKAALEGHVSRDPACALALMAAFCKWARQREQVVAMLLPRNVRTRDADRWAGGPLPGGRGDTGLPLWLNPDGVNISEDFSASPSTCVRKHVEVRSARVFLVAEGYKGAVGFLLVWRSVRAR
jgi:hypothetical protein